MRPILLGGYAAKSCARKIHNAYDATLTAPRELETPAELQQLFDLGNDHEEAVFDLWLATVPDVVDLRHLDEDKRAHVAATVNAMEDRRTVVLGGRLPDDPVGGRAGKPDALLASTSGGYHPCDVKAHKVLTNKDQGGLTSTLTQPGLTNAVEHELGLRHDERDLLQLAHYWRMLQACGYAASAPWGSIVGTDDPGQPTLAWYDLDEPLFQTFSRTRGKTRRSSLQRYDHEHDFRVRVAKTAQQRTGSPSDPEPLVVPVGQSECTQCAWAPVCVDTLPSSDLSAALPPGRVSVREYLALRDIGITTLDDLTTADLDSVLASRFADDNTHVRGLARRLNSARTAAELTLLDVEVRLKPGATFDMPRADIEIDLDIEWDRNNRVYLWGALITQGGQSTFVPFLDLQATDTEKETALARRCFDWISSTHPDALVYHYSAAEKAQARRILGNALQDYRGTAAHPDTWIDLLPYVRDGFDGRDGLGLKVIATAGAGFHWRDENPGGLQSQDWLLAALDGDAAASQRLLDYNEDDVRATLALRDWLTNSFSEGINGGARS